MDCITRAKQGTSLGLSILLILTIGPGDVTSMAYQSTTPSYTGQGVPATAVKPAVPMTYAGGCPTQTGRPRPSVWTSSRPVVAVAARSWTTTPRGESSSHRAVPVSLIQFLAL